MKPKKVFSILMVIFCFSFSGFGQNVISGKVLAVIPFGSQSYSVLHADGTENYYKTSPHQTGSLTQGQAIELGFGSNSIEVFSTSLSAPLFCELITLNNSTNDMLPLLRGLDIGYRNHVDYNSAHNVLVFETWNDVRSLELLLEESVSNYTFNQGNSQTILDVINLIRLNGWDMSPNQSGNTVSLPQFNNLLTSSYPLSSEVLIGLIELDEDEDLNSNFMVDVFTSNLPLSHNTEQRLTSATIDLATKDQILDANDDFLDAPNHGYNDFIATFPGYFSLYEKLNTEELIKLEAGMDPSDPNFDNNPVILPFERLIMNDKLEVWIEGRLYKLYDHCRAIALEGNVADAYQDLAVLNSDGSPDIPALDEEPEGITEEVMDGYLPSGFMVYNPQEFDPLGSSTDDPYYNTALQTYNLATGCPISNYTYSLYASGERTVDFYNMTDFSDIVLSDSSFYQYWTFGDGTGSFQENPIHTFPDYGTYTVRLTTFNSECGCWHVHSYQVKVQPPQLRDGNPDCPFDFVKPTPNWAGNPLSVEVIAEPKLESAVSPNTSVLNYHFAFETASGTLVHEEDRGVLNFIYHTFEEEGEYNVIVTATWDGGCVSTSDPHTFTLYTPEENPSCCDKKERPEVKEFKKIYDEDEYCLKINDLARGTFGTPSWRKIQGTQKLYIQKNDAGLWKKHTAWHTLVVTGTYWDREQDDITNEWYCFNPQPFDKESYTCSEESFQLLSDPGTFPNKFGLDEESIEITHKVYIGGTMNSLPATPHCCDCSNSGGYLLFEELIKFGICE
jgi:hypothetical protein